MCGEDTDTNRTKLAEVGGSLPKQAGNRAVESAPEVGCADDTPEVYKIPMARTSLD